jgi:hypothetical protein
MGFNATWFSPLYHDLIGDASNHGDKATVLHRPGFGTDDPIPLSQLSGSLAKTGEAHIVYHESHDEAGNSGGTMRTIRVAVNDAALVGPTRDSAEARTRVAAGISILSAGAPMFFMGEEIGAQRPCKYNEIIEGREVILGERMGQGANLFRYYQDLIRLRRSSRGLRSRNIDIIHASNDSRVIDFTRNDGTTRELIVASLNNRPFEEGTRFRVRPRGYQVALFLEPCKERLPAFCQVLAPAFGCHRAVHPPVRGESSWQPVPGGHGGLDRVRCPGTEALFCPEFGGNGVGLFVAFVVAGTGDLAVGGAALKEFLDVSARPRRPPHERAPGPARPVLQVRYAKAQAPPRAPGAKEGSGGKVP